MEDEYDIESDIVVEKVYRVGDRRFANKVDAIEYREQHLLDEFMKTIWGQIGRRYPSESVTANHLARQSGAGISKLMHHLKTVLVREGKEIPRDGLVNLDFANDDRIDQNVATELLMEAVWRVMLGQKSVNPNSFKKKVRENPDFFYKGLNDLMDLYAWKKLEESD